MFERRIAIWDESIGTEVPPTSA
ncbi:DUF6053 domain-containing protein [Lysobacter yananisis]